MVFRLPTHIESTLIPPPVGQVAPGSTTPIPSASSSSSSSLRSPVSPANDTPPQNTPPWRGSFVVSGLRASDRGSSLEIRVVGVEIEGNCQMLLWPPTLFFSVPNSSTTPTVSPPSAPGPSSLAHAHAQASRARSQSQSARVIRLSTMQAWLQQYQQQQHQTVAMVSFIPDRLRDPNANAVNQSNFRNLSRVLWDGQVVAVIPWNTPTSTGTSSSFHGGTSVGGILLYPAQNSSAILIGAVFIDQPFPDLSANPPPIATSSRHVVYSQQPQQHMISTSSQSPYRSTTYPHMPEPSSSQSRSAHSPVITTHPQARHHYQRHQSQSVSPISHVDAPLHLTTPVTPISAHQHAAMTPSSRQGEQPYRYSHPMSIPAPPMSGARTMYPPAPPILAPLPPIMGSITEEDGSSYTQPSSSTYGASSSATRGGHHDTHGQQHGQYGQ